MAVIQDSDYVGDSLGKLLLNENTTVNLNSSMSASEIQGLIDGQPKNLNGFNLNFQFGDGTYTLDSQLLFTGFFGGTVRAYGNSSDNSLSTSKNVVLNFNSNSEGVIASKCMDFDVRYMEISVQSSSNFRRCTYGIACPRFNVLYCYLRGNSTSLGASIYVSHGTSYTSGNYVSNIQNGIYAGWCSKIGSDGNDDTGTQPAYGLYALGGGVIAKNGTQPSGSTNEGTATGGEIR